MRRREIQSNQMNRKRGGGLCALVLAFLLAWAPAAAFADGPPTISVGSFGEAAPGTEFTVPVSIADNPGFAAAAFSLIYDKNALELVDVSSDGLLQSGQMNNIEGDSVGYFTISDMGDNGVLFSATFRVKDTAPGGSYEIQAGLREGLESNLVNASAEAVPVNFTAGSVQIPDTGAPSGGGDTPGDTSGDTPGGTEPDPGQSGQGGQDTPPAITTQTPGESKQVTAVAADGSEVQFLMRSTTGAREFSLDNGATWEAVPESGVITTGDGKTVSVDGAGGADYTVRDLPDDLVAATPSEGGGILIGVVVGIVAVIVVGVVIAFIIMRKRRDTAREMSSRARRFKENAARGQGADEEWSQISDTGEVSGRAARNARHLKEE